MVQAKDAIGVKSEMFCVLLVDNFLVNGCSSPLGSVTYSERSRTRHDGWNRPGPKQDAAIAVSFRSRQSQGVAEMAGPGQGRDKMQRMSSDSGLEMVEDPSRWLDPTRTKTRCCDSYQFQIRTKSGRRRDGRSRPRPGQNAKDAL